MSLNTWCHQGPHKPSSSTTFTLNSCWARGATGKKSFAPVCRVLGNVQLFAALWTVAYQASLSGRGFSRQEYWSVWANTG